MIMLIFVNFSYEKYEMSIIMLNKGNVLKTNTNNIESCVDL